MDRLNQIYGKSLVEFEKDLIENCGVSIQTLIDILEFEIKTLQANYLKLANKRDIALDVDLIQDIVNTISSKRDKLERYKIAYNNANKN